MIKLVTNYDNNNNNNNSNSNDNSNASCHWVSEVIDAPW